MPRFVWLSGPECAEMGVTTAYGLEWRVGVPQDVNDDLAFRIRRNRFFREAVLPDADGDGEISKAELLADAVRRGVTVDKRWGVARLREALAEAD